MTRARCRCTLWDMEDLCLKELMAALFNVHGLDANFTGDIVLMFDNGNLRSMSRKIGGRPLVAHDNVTKKAVFHILKAICTPLFGVNPDGARGFVTFHFRGGKISGFPDVLSTIREKDFTFGDENLGFQMRSHSIWWALKKNPSVPVARILRDPLRYKGICTRSIFCDGKKTQTTYYRHT